MQISEYEMKLIERNKNCLYYFLVFHHETCLFRCDLLTKSINKFLKSPDYSQEEKKDLTAIKDELTYAKKHIKNLGYCYPQFFVGDLLNVYNYIDYFDSIFYTQKDIITSCEERIPGHKILDALASEHVSKMFPEVDFSKISESEKNNLEMLSANEIVFNKIQELPTTAKLCEDLVKEENNLKTISDKLKKVVNLHTLS